MKAKGRYLEFDGMMLIQVRHDENRSRKEPRVESWEKCVGSRETNRTHPAPTLSEKAVNGDKWNIIVCNIFCRNDFFKHTSRFVPEIGFSVPI